MSKMQRIYGGILEFDARRHAYTFNGQPIPGCTTILRRIGKGDTLIQWAANQAADYVSTSWRDGMGRSDVDRLCGEAKLAWNAARKGAADIGSNVHAYAEAVLRGDAPPRLTTPEAEAGGKAFEGWLRESAVEPVAIERRVFSQKNWFAGTTDLVAVVNGRLSVIDFKTSSGIYPEYALQLAAYRMAWKEEHGIDDSEDKIDRWIVRFCKKTGSFETKQFKRDLLHERTFLHCLSLHKALQEMEATPETAKPQRTKRKAA